MCQCTKTQMEIPMFLMSFAFMFETTITANLIMYRTCHVLLGYNETECALLGTGSVDEHTNQLENETQPTTSLILMLLCLLDTIIPSITCMFLGPWTDKYGRKPVLIHGIAGYIVYYIILLLVSLFPMLSPWFFTLAYVPICLTGGFPSIYSAMLCYVSDVTDTEQRGFRLGLLDGLLAGGTFLGSITSTYVLNATNYVVIYSICGSCIIAAWLFILLLVPESVQQPENDEKVINLFKPTLFLQALHDTFKRRANYGRSIIIILISVQLLFYLSYESAFYILLLFVREKFHWSITKFTIYTSITTILWIGGNIFGTYILHKLLHVKEVYIITAGLLSAIFGSIWQAVATKDWHIYGGGASKWLGGAVSPMALSLLSKTVTNEEYGNVMSIISALDSLGYLAALPCMTWVYNKTLSTHPETFNFVAAAMVAAAVALMLSAFVIYKKIKMRPQIGYTGINTSEEPT